MDTQLYEEQFEVKSPARLIVKNIRGSVTVAPGEPGVIKVKAEQLLGTGSQDDTLIEIYQESKDVVYAVARLADQFSILNCLRPCKVNFTIEAPPDTLLKIKTVTAGVDVHGFQADTRIKTVSGGQNLADLTGMLDLDTVSGGIHGQALGGNAEISTVSGGIRLETSQFSSLRAKTVSADIRAETALEVGPYRLETVSGSIKLIVPADSQCQVHANAVSGRFLTDLQAQHSDVSRRSWYMQVGDGRADVSLRTVSGRMSLVSSWDSNGSVPGEKRRSREERKGVLTKLSQGELTVEQALEDLS